MKETHKFCHMYLDALILGAEPVVLHRGGTNFRNAYKHEVCAAYFNYPTEQRGETYTTIFTGSLNKVSKIADFMDTLGTPSFRFVASPVITIPPDHSCEEFDKQVSALSNLLEWCSNGEYWIGGGAVVKHKTGRCDCPECVDFHKWRKTLVVSMIEKRAV